MKVVKIDWVDTSMTHYWGNDGIPGVAHCETVGFLIDKNKESTTVALSLSDKDFRGGMITIPAVCIKKMRVLK